MKDRFMKSRYFKPVSYSLFFVIAFFIFLYITFPSEIIENKIVAEIERNTPYVAEVTGASLAGILGLKIEKVKLIKSPSESLEIDNLRLKPGLLSLLFKNKKLGYSAGVAGGSVDGVLRYNSEQKAVNSVRAKLEGVDIDVLPFFMSRESNNKFTISGPVNGELSVGMEGIPEGEFNFVVDGMELSNLKLGQFTLPALSGLTTNLNGHIGGESTVIDQLKLSGNGINMEVTGTTPLLWKLPGTGRIDLGFRVQITGPEYSKYKQILTSYLERQRDGSLGGKIIGTIDQPRFQKGSVTRF